MFPISIKHVTSAKALQSINFYSREHQRVSALSRFFIALLMGFLISHVAIADQYRSKLFLDPGKQLTRTVTLSLEELEQQINTMDDAYSKSSAGRHLARHYVNEKNYAKAIDYYQTALKAEGLSAVANGELLKELANVYVLAEQHKKAIDTLATLTATGAVLDTASTIVLAQAHFGLSDYVAVIDTLEPVFADLNALSEPQLNMLLGLYYNSGNYKNSETLLRRLITLFPDKPTYWRQLTSIFLMQNKSKNALDQLALARQKQIPFRAQDIQLLVGLYVSNNAAEKGARELEKAIATGEIKDNKENNKRLFEVWLQAREKEKAIAALKRTVSKSDDTELQLQLAQLLMEQRDWKGMNKVIIEACSDVLDDKYVSRSNLLLGVSQIKLGQMAKARRSFINATLVGGEQKKAIQWLSFIKAAPATESELRKISDPCYPDSRYFRVTKRLEAAPVKPTDQSPMTNAPVVAALSVKTVPKKAFFGVSISDNNEAMSVLIKKHIARMSISLVKAGGSMDGLPQLLIDNVSGKQTVKLVVPYRGIVSSRGRYKTMKSQPFKCVYSPYIGTPNGISDAMKDLAVKAQASGLSPTGQARIETMRAFGGKAGEVSVELQIGVQ